MMSSNWYERHILPYMIDVVCGMRMVRQQRQRMVPLACGRVLEVGIGTGLNLEHYDRERVDGIVGLDPNLEMHRLARKRAGRAGLAVDLLALSAEQIPADDSAFDSVVVTYSLCTIPEPVAALKEMRRVLKPGGKLIFCEHGLAPDEPVRRLQNRLTPWWAKIAGGCHLNRNVPELLQQAGFRVPDMEAMYLPGPRAFTYHYRGTAEAV
jgi:ubiquinone/menaquinone biosynthesis C-methylase UbiE